MAHKLKTITLYRCLVCQRKWHLRQLRHFTITGPVCGDTNCGGACYEVQETVDTKPLNELGSE